MLGLVSALAILIACLVKSEWMPNFTSWTHVGMCNACICAVSCVCMASFLFLHYAMYCIYVIDMVMGGPRSCVYTYRITGLHDIIHTETVTLYIIYI